MNLLWAYLVKLWLNLLRLIDMILKGDEAAISHQICRGWHESVHGKELLFEYD